MRAAAGGWPLLARGDPNVSFPHHMARTTRSDTHVHINVQTVKSGLHTSLLTSYCGCTVLKSPSHLETGISVSQLSSSKAEASVLICVPFDGQEQAEKDCTDDLDNGARAQVFTAIARSL